MRFIDFLERRGVQIDPDPTQLISRRSAKRNESKISPLLWFSIARDFDDSWLAFGTNTTYSFR